MLEEKSLKREILVWVLTYSLIFTFLLIFSPRIPYDILPGFLKTLLNLLKESLWILLPTFPQGILGFSVSFLALVLAHQLNLHGWKLIRLYMLPHPLIVSLFASSQTLFFHIGDTTWWGWLVLGGIAYFLLTVTAHFVSKLFMRLSGEL